MDHGARWLNRKLQIGIYGALCQRDVKMHYLRRETSSKGCTVVRHLFPRNGRNGLSKLIISFGLAKHMNLIFNTNL